MDVQDNAITNSVKPVVFIHVNEPQLIGAKIAGYCLKKFSKRPDAFDVRIIQLEDYPHLTSREGQNFKRKGKIATWHNRDLQSFTPLRFLPPQLMNFQGRALVIDPDVFALTDVMDLLERDMQGKGVMVRWCESYRGSKPFYATSVMLMDCEKLTHWEWDRLIDEMFAQAWDYGDWVNLRLEPSENIGLFEDDWNQFDTLTPNTLMLHTTERSTQPWKTGLPADFNTMYHGPQKAKPTVKPKKKGLIGSMMAIFSPATPQPVLVNQSYDRPPEHYLPHPDPNQERLFFTLFKECIEAGILTEDYIQECMDKLYLRTDAYDMLNRLEPFDMAAFRQSAQSEHLAGSASV